MAGLRRCGTCCKRLRDDDNLAANDGGPTPRCNRRAARLGWASVKLVVAIFHAALVESVSLIWIIRL